MVSINSVLNWRLHTLVTSAFSQFTLEHLLPNMLGLYFFRSEIAQIFGGRYLVNLYLLGGIAGSLGHVITIVTRMSSCVWFRAAMAENKESKTVSKNLL